MKRIEMRWPHLAYLGSGRLGRFGVIGNQSKTLKGFVKIFVIACRAVILVAQGVAGDG